MSGDKDDRAVTTRIRGVKDVSIQIATFLTKAVTIRVSSLEIEELTLFGSRNAGNPGPILFVFTSNRSQTTET